MKVNKYRPSRGDIVWMSLDPTLGHEQKGRRPSLIVSDNFYNKIGMCVCLPITSKIKGYSFEVVLSQCKVIKGAVMINQIRNVDWEVRHIEFIEKATHNIMLEVEEKLAALLVLNR